MDKIKTVWFYFSICLIAGLLGYFSHFYFNPKPPVISAPQAVVQTASGLQGIALENHFVLSHYQASSISNQIKESAGKTPDSVVTAKGSEWERVAKEYAAKIKADFAIVTDPKRPNSKPNPQAGDTVNLNQYNIFSYAKQQTSIGYGIINPELYVAHQWKVAKLFGYVGYVGPYGRLDFGHPLQSSIGVMITFADTGIKKAGK
jgi:hypothetical protein